MKADSGPRAADTSRFPDPVYAETVLKPLFDGAKTYFVDGFRRIDRAHLLMLTETGILPRADAAAIGKALAAIDHEVDVARLEYDGTVEDFFFMVEGELKRRLGPDLAGRLHTGRSRNDIDHTLFKLRLKADIDALAAKLRALISALLNMATRESRTIIVAYTHGQPAQPTTWGHYLVAMIEVLLHDAERLAAARRIADLSPMGSAAITTTGFPLDRARMATLLGFAAPTANSYGSIAAADYITATYGALELLFLHLGRPIQDLQFWTSFEVGQIYVPNAFVQISSIMPQKRNPVPIEHLRHLASQAFGRARAMLDIVHNTPFTDMNDSEGETQAFGFGAFATGHRVLDLLASLLPALSVDPARVAENLRRSCATVTELADSTVRIEGLSFRQAHEIAAHVARTVVAAEGGLAEDGYAPFREAFARTAGRPTGIDQKQFAEIVSPEYFIAVRDRPGGPAPAALATAIAGCRAALAKLTDAADADAAREQAAAAELGREFQSLTGGA
ncbi:argininosuccinate lyase [soil metagenome]